MRALETRFRGRQEVTTNVHALLTSPKGGHTNLTNYVVPLQKLNVTNLNVARHNEGHQLEGYDDHWEDAHQEDEHHKTRVQTHRCRH